MNVIKTYNVPVPCVNLIYFISSAMGKTRKVNKRFSFANNLILENDLSLLSGRLYTDINGIVFILGLGLFISLVNGIFLLQLTKEITRSIIAKIDANPGT